MEIEFLSHKIDYYHRAQRNRDIRFAAIEPIVLSILQYMGQLDDDFYRRFRSNKISTRFQYVLDDMKSVQKHNPFAKFVIFSQYKETLIAFQNVMNYINGSMDAMHIEDDKPFVYKYNCVIIDSSTPPNVKKQNLETFNDDPACNICLLTTGAAARGLTLTVAQTCYMLEPIQNAPEEAQALNRVHRIGQTESVRCVIFFAKGSCEERLLASRNASGNLTSAIANNELEGDEETTDSIPEETSYRRKNNGSGRNIQPIVANATCGYAIGPDQLKLLFGLTSSRQLNIEAEQEARVEILANTYPVQEVYTISDSDSDVMILDDGYSDGGGWDY